MDSLPIDTSHPAVRDYLSLVRLQVLTPLSLLINIAAVSTCAFLVNPSIGGIAKLHPTSITPRPSVIAAYVGAIYLGQIGYCLMLVMASKPETKRALVKGVGFSLVLANLVMALWAISWVLQWWLASTILQGILLLLLFYSNLALLIYHPPESERPLDTALIHAPMRFFFILPFSILFSLCLFITLGLTYVPKPGEGPPRDYSKWHAWTGFGVVFGTNLVGMLVILLRRDIVWAAAATWICVSIWSLRPKPAPVYITVIVFTILHPLSLIVSFVYDKFVKGRRQAVLLAGEEPALYNPRAPPGPNGPPREIDEETWG
ncbi:hypothetical protein DFP72DRAFT_968340 [Ephemerocybe angulata]|uniref:Uncharacterized protein n=1 Tax=Ephemerocybe angulata TaxID=980116 RepID=A0A8H6M4Z7_9AGAR|nr:hypothetical protein DFP72DRAFT_968340 [Tulosesus angulatus]